MLLKDKFSLFDPQIMDASALPNESGNYIIVLRATSSLPVSGQILTTPTLTSFEYKEEIFHVIYVGQSSTSLHTRIYGQHFNGTGGKSTLRKSLGCLLGFELIPRDIKTPDNGKTTFIQSDESVLTEWMRDNLMLFYYVGNDYADVEKELIRTYNPPLNLKGKFNKTNAEFRKQLSALRSNNKI